jgi:hypothetical protein
MRALQYKMMIISPLGQRGRGQLKKSTTFSGNEAHNGNEAYSGNEAQCVDALVWESYSRTVFVPITSPDHCLLRVYVVLTY